MHPKVKFKISVEKDVRTFFAFNDEAAYDEGRNLEWAIFKSYPAFKKYQKGNVLKISKKEVREFVQQSYAKRSKEIKQNMELYKKNWQKVEKDYFALVDNLFNKKYWPKGKYICYPTIWGMYPRFLEDSTFQVPTRQPKKIRGVNVIIAHEMLHFIFYKYFFTKYPKYKSDKYDFFCWHVSEIFNEVIQNSPEWIKVFELPLSPYPEHEDIVTTLQKKLYGKNVSTDEYISNITRSVKKHFT